MALFTLNESTPESEIFKHKGGNLTVYMNGNFGTGIVKFLSRYGTTWFNQLTDDDFSYTQNDTVIIELEANAEYQLIVQDPNEATSIDFSTTT